MKAMAGIYLVCLAASVLVFAIFPAEDTYVFPAEVRPVERVVETRVVERVVEIGSDDLVEITQYIVDVEERVEAVEDADDAWRADVDRRIKNATDYAVNAVTDTNKLWTKVAAVENETQEMKREFSGKTWILLGAFGLAWFMAGAAFVRTLRRWTPGGPVTTPPSSKSQPGREK